MAICTIILPVYKTPILAIAINSILNQTFTDFELLIGLDGEDIVAEKIINEFKDKRIRLYKFNHEGFIKTINRLAKLVNTEFTARMDADDYCAPERLEILISHLKNYKDAAGITSDYGYFSDKHKKIVFNNSRFSREIIEITEYERLSNSMRICDPSFVYRTSHLINVDFYDETIPLETVLQLKLINKYKLLIYDYPLYFNSFIINSFSRKSVLHEQYETYKKMLIKYTNLNADKINILLSARIKGHEKQLLNLIRKKISIELSGKNILGIITLIGKNPFLMKESKFYKKIIELIFKKSNQFRLLK